MQGKSKPSDQKGGTLFFQCKKPVQIVFSSTLPKTSIIEHCWKQNTWPITTGLLSYRKARHKMYCQEIGHVMLTVNLKAQQENLETVATSLQKKMLEALCTQECH